MQEDMNAHETARRLARGESRDYQEGLAHGHIAAMSQFAEVAVKLAQPPAITINIDPAELAALRAVADAARAFIGTAIQAPDYSQREKAVIDALAALDKAGA